MPLLRWDMNHSVLAGGEFYRGLSGAFDIPQANFQTGRIGGFLGASLTLEDVTRADVTDAVTYWLRKDIVATDAAGVIAYRGYVAELSAQYGYSSWARRISWIVNKVLVRYIKGANKKKGTVKIGTYEAADADSQSRYGIRAARLDITRDGRMKAAQAAQLGARAVRRWADYYDFEHDTSRKLRPQIRLTIYGYWTTLADVEVVFRYNKEQDIGRIVRDAVSASGQQWLSTDTSHIPNIGVLVALNAQANRKSAQTYINNAVKYGDTSYNLLRCQVWDDLIVRLDRVPTTINVNTRTDSPRVHGANNSPLLPYMVRAGDYAVSSDLLGLPDDSILPADSFEASMIEATMYDAVADTLKTKKSAPAATDLYRGSIGKRGRVVKE